MNKIIKGLLMLSVTLLITPLWGQQELSADELLEKIIKKTADYSDFKADLSYTMVNQEMDINEKKTGAIWVKGNAYRIEMEGQLIISDGKSIWTYLPDSEEVMVSAADDNDESISPTKILTQYNESYKARYDSDKKYKNASLKAIDLKPEDGNNFEQMSITVNVEKESLESFSVYDKNGNVFTYQILSLQPDLGLKDSFFVFDPAAYPGVEVIDMR